MCNVNRLSAVIAAIIVFSLNYGTGEFVTLIGTKPSNPPMVCEENAFTHKKQDGSELDIEQLSGEDGVLLIETVEPDYAGSDEKYSLTIKLTEDIAKNNYLFVGEWKCGENTWIVTGPPYIERLTLDWDEVEKHRPSTTVNEGNDVTFICESFVIQRGDEKPEFEWGIKAEDSVESPPGNLSRWMSSEVDQLKDNHWKSTFKLIAPGGVTKEDRYKYTCSVKVVGEPEMEIEDGILLRVKGKYAALWPAIGILLEVLVLAIGTILYERNKSKSAAAAAAAKDSDTSDVGLVQPSSSGGAVRKRNTVKT